MAANQEYVGPYPEPSYYGVDTMSQDNKNAFHKWYNGVTDSIFDFSKNVRVLCLRCANTATRVPQVQEADDGGDGYR